MTSQQLASFIAFIKFANAGQISVLLRILEQPLAEAMESGEAEQICKKAAKHGKV